MKSEINPTFPSGHCAILGWLSLDPLDVYNYKHQSDPTCKRSLEESQESHTTTHVINFNFINNVSEAL